MLIDIEKLVDEFRDQLPSEISLREVYDESYYFKEKFSTLYTSISICNLNCRRD